MHILTTIVPIFIVVMVGWGVHRRGFLPTTFVVPANRLVFYVAIPAMMVQAIIQSDLSQTLHAAPILLTLVAVVITFAAAWLVGLIARVPGDSAGTFIQTSVHGNIGYIGFAVVFYYMGGDGLAQAGVLAGFLMILQNILSIMALQAYAPQPTILHKHSMHMMLSKLLRNPVIVSILVGMALSIFAIPIPLVISRTLAILSGMALPLALLVIGASLSFHHMQSKVLLVAGASAIKLVVLPGTAWVLFSAWGLPSQAVLPALILLASPTATISYILSVEMNGDAELASAAVSASTLASAPTYLLWLKAASG